MTGASSTGHHLGVTSSYAAFIAPLQHIAARVHAIAQQAHRDATGMPLRPFIFINGHAGVKTGEDGPTHADPQALQLLQENFPKGLALTLTPLEPTEVWPLLVAALKVRPAVIAPFVTRPPERVPDRAALGIPSPEQAVHGLYPLLKASSVRPRQGTVVVQGSEVGLEMVRTVLPRLIAEQINIDVFYVSSAELFDLLPVPAQQALFTDAQASEAMGITGFTLPTLYRWVTSREGREASCYPFRQGRYLFSGSAEGTLKEAGLDGASLLEAILCYVSRRSLEASPASRYAPFDVGHRFRITPPQHPLAPEGRLPLIMARGAFGSGEHATTASCLEVLETLPHLKGARVLDVGSGTGILAIASSLLGAASALCVDIDPSATESGRVNARLNGQAHRISHFTGQVSDVVEGAFDLVLANVYADVLLHDAGVLVSKTKSGGRLLLSGIPLEEGHAVLSCYTHLGCRQILRRTSDGYQTLLLEVP